ncbi:hypothetical protein KUL152_34400 [Tenacibaculum sp. KUL152]|nr:hypothetical protein KUL152_34400 [Tenacibaculum sp. KUL152]
MLSYLKRVLGLSSPNAEMESKVTDVIPPKLKENLSTPKADTQSSKPVVKKKYSVYGNCQANPLGNILQTNAEFADNWEFVPFPKPSFELRQGDWNDIENLLGELDLFITQNVGESHGFFASSNLANHLKSGGTVVRIPNAYFSGYMPEVVYFRAGEPHVTKFCDYHDANFLAFFMEDPVNAVQKAVDAATDKSQYTEEFVLANAKTSIDELKRREEECDVIVSDYIEKNWRNDILFYSINHPKTVVLSHIASQILKLLNQSTSDVHDDYEYLDNTRPPIYESVKGVLQKTIEWQVTVINQEIDLVDYFKGHARVLRTLEPKFLRGAYGKFKQTHVRK